MTTDAMTAQQVFDAVVRHVAGMPRRAYDERRECCVYRTADGLSCAVGGLITEEEANAVHPTPVESEDPIRDRRIATIGTSVLGLLKRNMLPQRLMPHVDLLSDLQSIHDASHNWTDDGQGPGPDKAMMRISFLKVAGLDGLDLTVVDEVFPA